MLVLDHSVSLMEITMVGENSLIGYDWGVGNFTFGFYYYDFQDDADGNFATADDDGAYVSIGYSM